MIGKLNCCNKLSPLLRKIIRVTLIFVLIFITLISTLLLLIQSRQVQNYARKEIQSYLGKKLHTKVEIDDLSISFPKMIVLHGVYIQDLKKDTLLYGNLLMVDINMYKLVFGDIQISDIRTSALKINILRQSPDTTFNYQFIMDAFSSDEPKPDVPSTLKMALDHILLGQTDIKFIDYLSGNNVVLHIEKFQTKIDVFDPIALIFDVPEISISGVRGKINQSSPIEIVTINKTVDRNTGVAKVNTNYLKINNKHFKAQDLRIDYTNEVSALHTSFKCNKLNVFPEKIDLSAYQLFFNKIELDQFDAAVQVGRKNDSELIIFSTGEGKVLEKVYLPWMIKSSRINISQSNLKFDDETKLKVNHGMDFGHLDVKDLNFSGDNFYFHKDSVRINVKEGSLQESSGFILSKLQSDILYTNSSISLRNVLFKTPGSELRKHFDINYPSLTAAIANPNHFDLDLEFDQSRIQVKDILLFVPLLRNRPGFKNPDLVMSIDGRVTGNLKKINFQSIVIQSFKHTKADFSGSIENIRDSDEIFMNLIIRNFSTSSDDIKMMASNFRLPENVTIPKSIALSGTITGDMDSLYTDAKFSTSAGNATFTGYVKNLKTPANTSYDADVTMGDFHPGEISVQAGLIQNIDAEFNINGLGTSSKTLKAKLRGVVKNIRYNNYDYTNISVNSLIDGQYIKANGNIRDPNISLRFSGEGEMTNEYPCIILDGEINRINAKSLHFTKDDIAYKGNLLVEIPAFDIRRLIGEIHITDSDFTVENKKIHLDSMSIKASFADNTQHIGFKSDFLNAAVIGEFEVMKLGEIFKNMLRPYYTFNHDTLPVSGGPFHFSMDAQLSDHPILRFFLPGLHRMEKVSLNALFTDASRWTADLSAPFIGFKGNIITDTKIAITADGQKLKFKSEISNIKAGESVVMNRTKFSGEVSDQKVNFSMRIGDKEDRDRYIFGGLIRKEADDYSLAVNADKLMLNYAAWNISNTNKIRFGKELLIVKDFDLSKGNQHLVIKSKNAGDNSPLEIVFTAFRLSTLTEFVRADSMVVDGTLDGHFVVDNINTRPVFTSDIIIKDLYINKDTLGDIGINISNAVANVYRADILLNGRENNVRLAGNYNLKPENKANLDFVLDIKRLQMKTLEGASFGNLRASKGYLSGKVNIGGSLASPDIGGKLEFFQTSMMIAKLNSEFKVDNGQLLAIDNTGLRFNNFTIKDVSDNRFTIDGMAFTKNYINYDFDLRMRARNFKALNSTRADNQAYYGQIYFDTDMKISGTEKAPVIDGRIRINEGTTLTIVIPQKEPGLIAREGVVVFVDKSKPNNSKTSKSALDSLNMVSFVGMDVSVNIEVDKKATLTLVIDEGNNDFIRLKGEAVLNGGIDKSGKVTLTGTYELDEGTYELSFNLIDRRFNIQKGSKITWAGEPTDAILNITAVYVSNTTAVELVQDQIVAARSDLKYRQKLPFEVHLTMNGTLLKPELSFEIKLPKESMVRTDSEIASQIEMRLNQLQAEPSELNKQVFSLLILNRFTSQNPFESAGGGLNPEAMARQSISKIMTEQLNNLANDLISGVDINFDIVASEDFTSGKLQNKTDFNVGVSKKLFSERLNVSVGTNIALEGSQQNRAGANPGASNVPNINIEYLLSKDGRYMLRAYRRNQYEGIVEGFIVETGVGFVMSVDYDQFKDIFEMRKSNRDRKKEQKISDQQNSQSGDAQNIPSDNQPNPHLKNIRKHEDE